MSFVNLGPTFTNIMPTKDSVWSGTGGLRGGPWGRRSMGEVGRDDTMTPLVTDSTR